MSQVFRRLFFILALPLLASVIFLLYKKIQSNTQRKCILSFYEENLYDDEISELDDAEKEEYINNWILNHFLERELKKIDDKSIKLEIDKKVLNYRSALLTHIYLERLISREMNISKEDIEIYYKNNASSFTLKESVFRGILIIVPKNLKETNTIKSLLESQIKNISEIEKCCFHVAKKYYLDDTIWQTWEKGLEGTPYINNNINHQKFSNNKLFIEHDKTYVYYLWITELKKPGETAPLPLVVDKVKKNILTQNKLEMERKILANILSLAKSDKNLKKHENTQ